ncbi:restriction endonuclease type II-like protein [Tribonema minus]|uniref:Crossover junction endonuclease MUS81 n=1 Tax=Tribonema minus TaxID=303371 RepID=A0A836CKB8_9STRA|nr:restriction endonuclease type II-like protein [Tribonema minus]
MLPCPTSFAGGIWTPVLIFDTREEHAQASQAAVLNANMLCEVRSLPLGDMLWVARNMDRQSPSYLQEVLLGYIVERKTASDLGSSMVDGRFHEQKHRMARHGLGRVIYLVEGPITHTTRLTPAHLRTAMAHTQAQDGMTVLWTANVTESVAHLQRVHRHIAASLEAACRGITASAPGTGVRPIMSMDQYRAQCGKGKDGDVRYVFGCQLRQVYGCSAARAAAILNEYPTPLDFMLAMEAAGESERCLELLAGIKGEPGARMAEAKLTKPLQAALCKLYADDDYH